MSLSFMNTIKRRTSQQNVCGFAKRETLERFGGLPVQRVRGPSANLASIGSSKEWRTKMAELLVDNARDSHQYIVQQMEEICRDLEFRCHNVEAPLRAVSEERDNLQSQLEEVKRVNLELEVQMQQSSTLISDLRGDIVRFEEQANIASNRAENLAAQLATTERELDSSKQESQESAELERTKARTRELDLMATLTEREDQLDELQAEMQNLKRDFSNVKETRENISKERNAAIQERDALRLEITKLKDSLNTKTTLCLDKDNQIQCLTIERENALVDIQNLQIKVIFPGFLLS
jgi:chromosome segregation ATPase